jgi:hypothetical protein
MKTQTKNIKNLKNILLLICGIVIGLIISHIKLFGKPDFVKNFPTPTPTDEQVFDAEMNKYIVNIPAKYFDGNTDTFLENNNTIIKGFFIDDLPQAIPMDDTIQAISESFDQKKICGQNILCGITAESNFDVDGDSKKEQVISMSTGVNHGVQNMYIVKDGKIIFKDEGSPDVITKSESRNGFYLTNYLDTFLAQPGQITRVRYIYNQGKFIPVWTQTSTELQTTQP